jgi:hypothetical protein
MAQYWFEKAREVFIYGRYLRTTSTSKKRRWSVSLSFCFPGLSHYKLIMNNKITKWNFIINNNDLILGSTHGRLCTVEFFCSKLEPAIYRILQIVGGIGFNWKRRLALFSDEPMRNGTISSTKSVIILTIFIWD